MTNPISVIIVDDHEVVREGVRAFLDAQTDITVVGEAASGEDAVILTQDLIPDVVLMDLVMPEMDGVEATRRLKAVSPRTQIVVLTSYHQDEHLFPAIQAGAISYILKDVALDDLANTIRKAAVGEATLHPSIAVRVIQEIHGAHKDDDHPYTALTAREIDVLKLIASGLTNSNIAEQLVISENTVKGHVSNILSKLHLADRTQAAVYAWREGIVKRD
jgi:NarL family two-component system response regulator LiaR